FCYLIYFVCFFFQAEDGIRDRNVTGVQTCALPIFEADNVFSLLYKGETAGFYAFDKNKVLLLGIKKEFQGKGLTKSFASKGCEWQFDLGYDELYTSISPANVASLNLFISLGFRLRKTVDVYHKLNGPAPTAGV